MLQLICLLVFFAAPACVATAADALPFPKAEKEPRIDSYFGVDVRDDYQWMEKAGSPEVKKFAEGQNDRARKFLDAIPERAQIKATLTDWYSRISPNYFSIHDSPAGLFMNQFAPPKQQPLLILVQSPNDPASAKIILDPETIDPSGKTAIDWWVPSHNGKFVAVSISKNGSEEGTLHIYDVANGKPLPEKIPRVQYPTGGGSAAWNADDSGLYYTRYPAPGEKPDADIHFYQTVSFHKLGDDPKSDVYAIGKEFPRIAEIELESTEDGSYLVASVANGDGGDFAHYILPLKSEKGDWKQVTKFTDAVKQAVPGKDGSLYLLARKGAPHGRILRVPLETADLALAAEVVPQSEGVIQDIEPGKTHLYVRDLLGGPSRLRQFDLDGANGKEITTPSVSSIREMVQRDDGRLLFRVSSYLEPTAWYDYNPVDATLRRTALATSSPVDFSDVEVERVYVPAIDGSGTRIPLNILKPKGLVLDGNAPAILYAYGSYGISMEPGFNFTRKLWLERGGIYAIANLRGGGEYGEEWHKAANLTKKQTTFDDLAACAKFLVHAKYTNPQKLAIEGGSAGGLLMGAAMTQHPELYRAVVSYVGIYDSLRTEVEPNGEFNITEFGTVKDRAQFRALYEYSPYQRVKQGTKYPAVLLTTGLNDGRVASFHSLKMTSALQEATASPYPILLRVNFDAGHGQGTSLNSRIDEDADVWSFLIQQLGISTAEKAAAK
ncbi:MAG TPA: prolyl oligopeptidase family serine peptidase [Chthoniobacterales bacterium]